ncbi:MAG: hypothetical protein JSS27_10040 [Planctomycetes bacterium]|nr:hypothetical protein [Planctomycetota bacterium]
MRYFWNRPFVRSLAIATSLGLASLVWAVEPGAPTTSNEKQPAAEAKPTAKAKPAATPAPPKPLGDATKKGLEYLVSQQQSDGGWGQGGGWRVGSNQNGRVDGANIPDPTDLGNTCIATLALIRAGNSTTTGSYSANVAKATEYIVARVEKSDASSMYITEVRDTQLQSKIGQYVDTFLAGLVLSELRGKVEQVELAIRANKAMDKVVAKIERNQQQDGTFAGNGGWASVLSQGLCSKALNRAFQNGVAVRQETLDRDFKVAQAATKPAVADLALSETKPVGRTSGLGGGAIGGMAGPGTAPTAAVPLAGPVASSSAVAGRALGGSTSDAGVSLYRLSVGNAVAADNVESNAPLIAQAESTLRSDKASKDEKQQAQQQLDRARKMDNEKRAANKDLVDKLGEKQFVAGFGNNGGEEFLSYMNISETMRTNGGEEWLKWDREISTNLQRVQNGDGSWSGHHCITGRTFTSATALLTLMADRAPIKAPKAQAETAQK